MAAQTFLPSPKRLFGPALTVALFFAWAVVALVLIPRAFAATPVAGRVALVGVPMAMGLLSAVYLLGLMARTTLDDEGLTIAGPLGRRTARWADVIGHDVVGTARQGVVLHLRSGRRLGVPFLAYAGDGPRKAIEGRLRRLPPPNVEGRAFFAEGRWELSGFLLAGLLLFAGVGARTPMDAPRLFWGALAVLAVAVPLLVASLLNDRIVLQDGTLTKRSLFGVRRLVLAEATRAEIRLVGGRGGAREQLILTGPVLLRITSQREGYAMLRDAVVRALPPGVRPKPLA